MATVLNAGAGVVDVLEGTGPSLVILTVLLIVCAAAAYFTGRLYGRVGVFVVIGAFFTFIAGLWALGGLSFG
jgi:hypothetical protein